MALDQEVVWLAQAIREHETGNRAIPGASGELASRYQFLPATWREGARKYLDDPDAPLTLENENKVAYSQIKEWKDQGLNPGQIAAAWNGGIGVVENDRWKTNVGVNKQGINFDTPAYVDSVYSNYKRIKSQKSSTLSEVPLNEDVASSQEFRPIAPFAEGESIPISIAKAGLNLPLSTGRFLYGALAELSPKRAGERIGEGIVEFSNPELSQETSRISIELADGIMEQVRKGNLTTERASELLANLQQDQPDTLAQTLKDTAAAIPKSAFKLLAPKFIQDIFGGNAEEARRTVVNDPAGQLLPLVLAGEGLSRVARRKGPASAIVEGTKKAGEKVGEVTGKTGEFVTAQTFGLSPETIRTIVRDPDGFTAADIARDTRLTTAAKVKASIDAAIEQLSSTGKEYASVRAQTTPVTLPNDIIQNILKAEGVGLEKGRLVTTAESTPLSLADVSAIEGFIKQYGPENIQSANAILNARRALDNIAKWDGQKTSASADIARDIRKAYDNVAKKQVKGLKELDAKYAPEVSILKQIKKEYQNPDGTLKDGAINKIANLLGAGKEPILARLETIAPGITRDIRIIKALEDVQYAQGQKVGSYSRSLAGIGGGAAVGGPVGALVGAILTSPQVAVAILKAYGRFVGATGPLLRSIEAKLEAGAKLTPKESAIMTAVIQAAALDAASRNSEGPGKPQEDQKPQGSAEGRNVQPQPQTPEPR